MAVKVWNEWRCTLRGCTITRSARVIGSPTCPRHGFAMARVRPQTRRDVKRLFGRKGRR